MALLGSMTALAGAGAYILVSSRFSKGSKDHEACAEHVQMLIPKIRMKEFLEDLRIELTP